MSGPHRPRLFGFCVSKVIVAVATVCRNPQRSCHFAARSFDVPLASMLTEQRRVVRKQSAAPQHRRILQDTTNQHSDHNCKDTPSAQHVAASSLLLLPNVSWPTIYLDSAHKLQLQQQIQQVHAHVSLLIHLFNVFSSSSRLPVSTICLIARATADSGSSAKPQCPHPQPAGPHLQNLPGQCIHTQQ